MPLSLPTTANSTDESNGTVTATIQAETPSATTYELDINTNATITIIDNDEPNKPVITITGTTPIDEGQGCRVRVYCNTSTYCTTSC